jgi:hypothetical protein
VDDGFAPARHQVQAFIAALTLIGEQAGGTDVPLPDEPDSGKSNLVEGGKVIDDQPEKGLRRPLLPHLQEERLDFFIFEMEGLHGSHALELL